MRLRVSFCRNDTDASWPATKSIPMDAGSRTAQCRVSIYLPDDVRDTPVVICSEVPNNPGGSITNSAEVIAAGVIRANELPTPLVWIEHRQTEGTGGVEAFELVAFSSYEVTERALYLGETRVWIGADMEAA